jgi:F-type H+-transporting ATPase subunit a
MDITDLSPDQVIFFEWGVVTINATLVYTWITMAILIGASWLVTRRLVDGPRIPRWQHVFEVLVLAMRDEIQQVSRGGGERYLPFVGTLFLFIALANVLGVVPGYLAPTGSLSTTIALALSVLIAVPAFGMTEAGPREYLRRYLQPSVWMLPFNLMGEASRTLALAVRLFGNVMSATKIAAILLALTPLLFPVLMQAFGLVTGLIQAYIFAVLATVYIGSAVRSEPEPEAGDGERRQLDE